jgi:hypothetical protein
MPMLNTPSRTLTTLLALGLSSGLGCALTRPVPADVHVPPELLRGSSYTAAGEPPRSRYVVRMTDGQRDWEIQLPEIATAYEVKVPLTGKPGKGLGVDMATMTAADREILDDRQASERAAAADSSDDDAGDGTKRAALHAKSRGNEESGDESGSAGKRRGASSRTAEPGDSARTDKPPAQRASYLLTLAKVKDLYRSRHYELALVELVELERQYPNDEHILSMKGSLHERLGNKGLAREAWQQVLTLNPFNLAVLEALQRLGK